MKHVLQAKPSKDDEKWKYTVPAEALAPPRRKTKDFFGGKCIRFSTQEITLQIDNFPSNRILTSDDPSQFILMSFSDLRFPEAPLRATGEYISRLMQAGLFLNGVEYRFYHHSNSQLVCLP